MHIHARIVVATIAGMWIGAAIAADEDGLKSRLLEQGLKWTPSAVEASTGGQGTGANMDPLPNQRPVTGPNGAPNSLGPTALVPTATVSPALDLRWTTGPIRDQGGCGSCVAFATVAAVEAAMFGLHLTGTHPDYSEQEVLSCSGAYSSCENYYGGVPPLTAYLSQTGRVFETAAPYTSGYYMPYAIGACPFPPGALADATSKVAEWGNFHIATATDLKYALFFFQLPLVARFNAYTDIHRYRSGVYQPLAPGTPVMTDKGLQPQQYESGHAVLVVGYDDADQAFLVRNSWHSSWGESGYFRIAYSEVSEGSLTQFATRGVTGVVSMQAPPGPILTPQCRSLNSSTAVCDLVVPKDKEYVDFEVWAEAYATGHGTGSGTMQLNMLMAGVPCNTQYGATYGVNNATLLIGDGFTCSKRLFGGQSARVSIVAPNDRADAVYTVAAATFTEAPPGPATTTADCASPSAGTAYCDLAVPRSRQYADFTVTGDAYATGDGTNSGSMQLNMSANGDACNSQFGVSYGVDNATHLTGAGFTCVRRVPGGQSIRVTLNAPNNRANAVYTKATATFVNGPLAPVPSASYPLSWSGAALSFAATPVGTPSLAQTITLANVNPVPVPIASITTSGPFAQSNSCGASIPALSGCTISVTFSPTAPSGAGGTLIVGTGGANDPSTVQLSGTGVVNPGPPILQSAASRKVHAAAGAFDLPLSLTPTSPTTEPRLGSAATVVMTFDKAVTAADVAVTAGSATAGAPTFNGKDAIVGLTGIANAKYVTLSLTNVRSSDGGNGGSGTVRIGFLEGDVNGSRNVTLSDLLSVNSVLAQPLSQSNFLRDVNVSGTLTLSDLLLVNSRLTQLLPGP